MKGAWRVVDLQYPTGMNPPSDDVNLAELTLLKSLITDGFFPVLNTFERNTELSMESPKWTIFHFTMKGWKLNENNL